MKNLFVMAWLMLGVTASWADTAQDIARRQNFLTETLIRLQMETIINNEANKNVLNCLNNPNNRSEICLAARSQVVAPFQQVVTDARLHLAMGYRDSVLGSEAAIVRVNSSLNTLSTYKDTAWQPLNAWEQGVANALMNRYIERYTAEAARDPRNGQPGSRQFIRNVRLLVRQRRIVHLNIYKGLISQIVLLQYVAGPTVTPAIMRAALTKIVTNSESEVRSLSRIANTAKNWVDETPSCISEVNFADEHPILNGLMRMNPSGGVTDTTPICLRTPGPMLKLLDYRAAVEGVLMDNPNYRRIYDQLNSERTLRSIEMALVLGLPTLAVCIIAPPLVAIPVGAAAGGLALLQAQSDYNTIRRRELSVVVNAAGNVDWDALKNGRLMRNISVVLLPFFGAGRFVGPAARGMSASALKYINGFAKIKYARFAR